MDAAGGAAQYFAWQRLRVEALEPLSRGAAARYRPFDWQAGHYIADTGVPPRPQGLVVVDEVLRFPSGAAHLVSLAELVEAQRDEQLRRIGVRGPQNGACTHDGRPPRITTSVTSGRAIR